MEEVIEVYLRPDDSQNPVGCFEESNKQLVKETPTTLPMKPPLKRTNLELMNGMITSTSEREPVICLCFQSL